MTAIAAIGRRHGAAVAAAMIGFVLGAGALTWRIDQSLYDGSLLIWTRPVADDIVIVAIDDASLKAIGRWPWPRAVHATLLQTLAAAKPRAIALDLLLSEPDGDPRADAVLAAALARAAPVVLPSYFYAAPTRGPQELAPAPSLGSAAQLAHMDTDTDADGVLRHAWLRAGIGDSLRPHLAVALLEAAGERVAPSVATLRAPPADVDATAWRRDERLLIRYAGPPGTVPAIPYASVLRAEVPPSAFAGKLVLIGATARGLGDAFPTPVSGRAGPMSGVEISAQLADALRAGHQMRAVPPWAVGTLSALLALLLFTLFARATARRSLQIATAAVVLLPPASLLLMAAGLWLPPTALALTALVTYPLWSWRRLEAANRFFDDELARWNDAVPAAAAPSTPAASLPVASSAKSMTADPLERRLVAVRAAGDRVRQARRFVADSLAALPEAVLVTRADGTVQIANARAAALLGAADAETLVGRPLVAVLAPLSPMEAAGWSALVDAARHAGEARVTRARHGEQVDLLTRIAPFGPAQDTARALVVSIADVTRLTSAERSRDELLAFVTHDLRSPQASLVSLAELARHGQLPMTPAEVLEQVELLARRTLELADDFLRLAAAETRELEAERFDLGQCAREAVDETRTQAQARALTLAFDAADTPVPVHGEPALLRRACVNLLTNAIKFSPEQGVIEVAVLAQDGQAVFLVRDHGPGIAPDVRARLFRKYERAASVQRRPGALQDVGLGLVFVETVAHRHGGRVTVDSTPGDGAHFALRLPLAAPAADTAGAPGPPTAPPSAR